MLKRLRLLVLFLVLLSFAARAQTDFRPGYVIPLTGDTLRGEIDNRSDLRNATQCRFRQGTVREFAPAELRGYGINGGKTYRTSRVTVPDSLTRPAQTYFLAVLLEGALPVYYRRDINGLDHYFIGTAAAAATELVQRRTLVSENGVQRYQERNLFRGTLAEALATCPTVQQRVAELRFKESALLDIVQRYNACLNPAAPAPTPAVSKARVTLGVFGGLGVSQLQLRGFTSLDGASFRPERNFVGGLQLGFFIPRLSEKLSIQLGSFYQHLEYSADFQATFGSGRPYREQARVEFRYVKVPLLLRYTYPRGKVQPVVQLGMTGNISLEFEAEYRQQQGTGFGSWQPAFDKKGFSRFDWGPTASLGAQTRALGGRLLLLEGRIERSTTFIYVNGIDSKLWHYYVLLGVNLTK